MLHFFWINVCPWLFLFLCHYKIKAQSNVPFQKSVVLRSAFSSQAKEGIFFAKKNVGTLLARWSTVFLLSRYWAHIPLNCCWDISHLWDGRIKSFSYLYIKIQLHFCWEAWDGAVGLLLPEGGNRARSLRQVTPCNWSPHIRWTHRLFQW